MNTSGFWWRSHSHSAKMTDLHPTVTKAPCLYSPMACLDCTSNIRKIKFLCISGDWLCSKRATEAELNLGISEQGVSHVSPALHTALPQSGALLLPCLSSSEDTYNRSSSGFVNRFSHWFSVSIAVVVKNTRGPSSRIYCPYQFYCIF